MVSVDSDPQVTGQRTAGKRSDAISMGNRVEMKLAAALAKASAFGVAVFWGCGAHAAADDAKRQEAELSAARAREDAASREADTKRAAARQAAAKYGVATGVHAQHSTAKEAVAKAAEAKDAAAKEADAKNHTADAAAAKKSAEELRKERQQPAH